MATLVPSGDGRILNKMTYLGKELPEEPYDIILKFSKGEVMKYGTSDVFVVDFPGEYEHAGIVVRCREAGDELHYILRYESGETIALLLNPKSVEHDALKSANLYYCVDQETKDRIEQNEFEGEVMLFDQVNH